MDVYIVAAQIKPHLVVLPRLEVTLCCWGSEATATELLLLAFPVDPPLPGASQPLLPESRAQMAFPDSAEPECALPAVVCAGVRSPRSRAPCRASSSRGETPCLCLCLQDRVNPAGPHSPLLALEQLLSSK